MAEQKGQRQLELAVEQRGLLPLQEPTVEHTDRRQNIAEQQNKLVRLLGLRKQELALEHRMLVSEVQQTTRRERKRREFQSTSDENATGKRVFDIPAEQPVERQDKEPEPR